METFSLDLEGRTLKLETGRLAKQAGGAVLISYGETVLLVTATMSDEPREGVDFFPLTVDYEERLYAVGRIPVSYTHLDVYKRQHIEKVLKSIHKDTREP